MASGQEPAAPQSPHQGTSEGGIVEVRPHTHSDGADSARSEHGALARCKNSLLAPEELVGDLDSVEPQGSGESPKDTVETRRRYWKWTETGEQNGQRVLLTCGHPEDKAKKRGPSKWQQALNACSHQGGEGGEPPPRSARLLLAVREWRGSP